MKIKNIILTASLLLLPFFANAQGPEVLQLAADARNVAMGGNFFGESHSMYVYGNPTSIFNGNKNYYEVNASGSFRSFEDSPGDGVGNMKFMNIGASLRFGIHAVHIGGRKLDGLKIADNKPSSGSIDLGYALNLGKFSLSAGASYVRNKLKKNATGMAFNAAAYYRTKFDIAAGSRLVVGLGGGNLGCNLKSKEYSNVELPKYFGGGGEFGIDFNQNHSLNISLGSRYYAMKGDNSMMTVNLGAEYSLFNIAALRTGWFYGENKNSAITFGGGIKYMMFSLDGAYVMPSSKYAPKSFMISLAVNF